MSIKPDQLRKYVIQPALRYIGAYSEDAEELLILTAAQETHLGQDLHQVNGPALGIFQMEPATAQDIYDNFLIYRPHLLTLVSDLAIGQHVEDELCGNLYYAAAMARCTYLRHSEPLPDKNNLRGMAEYYKKYYNTVKGAAKLEDIFENYHRYT
ncbi:MAG TPA: hypothetical protein VK031_01995 [Tissierellaceae bacterium]|nr:hypothetical protein [Tissierellaceae bacterium]